MASQNIDFKRVTSSAGVHSTPTPTVKAKSGEPDEDERLYFWLGLMAGPLGLVTAALLDGKVAVKTAQRGYVVGVLIMAVLVLMGVFLRGFFF